MDEQMRLNFDGSVEGQHEQKERMAIERLKSFEPADGYYVAFSGGKDSQCVYHLCKLGGVKFDAHYAITSVDPPELVRFIRRQYPDVIWERQHDKDGKPITMWNLIASHTLPPTRKVRYCCAHLKEPGGEGRVVVTGVRWAESNNRKLTHGVVGFRGKPVSTQKIANEVGADYKLNKHGDVILNDDNDENRRMVEQCYRTRKTMVNPIVDWTDEDVWWFLNKYNIPHCELYDQGFTRLGCIGCPLSGSGNMIRDFERWPKYKELYIRAFQRMIDNHPGQIKILDPNADTKFKLYEDEAEKIGGGQSLLQQRDGSDAMVHQGMEQKSSCGSTSTTVTDKFVGGGTMVRVVDGLLSLKPCLTDGPGLSKAEYVYSHWLEMGAI